VRVNSIGDSAFAYRTFYILNVVSFIKHGSMNDKQILDFLKTQVSLFKLISDKHVENIAQGSQIRTYEVNEAIVRFGEDASFYGVLFE